MKEILEVIKDPNISSRCSWEQKHSYKKGDTFFVYAIPAPDHGTQKHEILIQYQDYKDVFEKKNVDTLPKHRQYDYAINLEEGTQPLFGPIYNLSENKLLALGKSIEKNLEKGFIRHSKSPIGVPMLFVKKKNGFLCMCVNYRGLNRFTIKNRYPLPLISRLLDQLSHAKIYTKIDLHGAHNLVHFQEGDEWKMTFKICYNHFEYVVMPFGFTNAHVVFQHIMNDVFREYLDDFVVCYIDDIFIFSKNMVDHQSHVHLVLEKLRKVGLYAKLGKCGFHQSEVEFLGYIISRNGAHMDPCKFKPLWIGFIHDVQCFIGFANFYRQFITHYSIIMTPCTCLIEKDQPFSWGVEVENAFQYLKASFKTAPL